MQDCDFVMFCFFVVVGLDRFIVRDVFLSVFLMDLLLQYKMGRSTRSRLDVSASLDFLQYWCVLCFFYILIIAATFDPDLA